MTKEKADIILNAAAEILMNNDETIQYLASVKKNDSESEYFIEKGVLINGEFLTKEINISNLFFEETEKEIIEKGVREILDNEPHKLVDEIVPLNINNHKIRPYLSGCKIKSDLSGLKYGGTLGAILKVKNNGNIYLISNHHILSSKEKLNFRELIFQPCKLYGKELTVKKLDYSNAIASLSFGKYGDSLRNDGRPGNTLDIAFAKIIDPKTACYGFTSSSSTLNAKQPILKSIQSPKDQMTITMHGKTSGSVKSIIRSTNAFVRVKHSYSEGDHLIFKNQILLDGGIGKKGDSGAALVNQNDNVVGIVHAGDQKNITFANNIDHIFNHVYEIPLAKNQKIAFDEFLT